MADALADELGAMAGMLSFDGFINMMDMIMMAHFVGFSVVGSGGELAELSMSAQTGLYLYLLVPLVALMIGGFVSAKQNAHFGVFERFNLSVVIGAVYGAVLAVFSLFAGTSMALDMGEFGGPGMDIAVSGQYSFFAALWHGFLLGTIFSFFGALMQFGPPKVTSHLSGRLTYGESLHQAISTVIRGVLLSVFVLLVVFLVQFGGEVFDDTFMFIVLLTQLGGYLWVLLNFIPFSMSADMFGESGALNVSVLSGFEAVGEMGDTAVLNDYGIYLYLGLLLPIALFLWAGYRIRLQVKGDVLKAVLAFSGTYALLMAALATLTAFSFEMNAGSLGVGAEMLEVSIGFGFFTTLFISFITASLLTYAGTLFVKAEE
ncbi:hypothetical protein [Texcoconibacillus texcoconensis]|uniref:Uncharacterized protein n=1 Tax=Texcoconibacillus texcoconensis TaxID=1095777 RepID=A0A840QR91_9BACI|nr:hypothetical protein [Texcoconibacillus texcoconensis]MBB5173869.1 hypothetical protein [Texcoconibacillus texcoconensis]